MATLKFKVDVSGWSDIKSKIANMSDRAEHIVAVQAAKDTSPYVPAKNLMLDRTTRVEGNTIIYPGPYARYLYYGKVMVDAETGRGPAHFKDKFGNELIRYRKGATLKATEKNLVFNTKVHSQARSHWFEASKAQNLDKWLRVAQKAVDKYGPT